MLDDKTRSINLVASEGKTISVVDEGDQAGISLKAGSKNSITLNAKGINCSSEGNGEIIVEKAVTISTEEGVTIKAQKVEVE